MSINDSDFIPTKGSKLNPTVLNQFQSVTYEPHKSQKSNQKQNSNNSKTDNPNNLFNIKKAKYEVIKFGMSGFTPKKKEEAKIQLAIQLGAKPPKNKYKNYKELLQEKARAKERQKNRVSLQQVGKNHIGKSTAKGKKFDKNKKIKKGGILDVYGKVKITPKT